MFDRVLNAILSVITTFDIAKNMQTFVITQSSNNFQNEDCHLFRFFAF